MINWNRRKYDIELKKGYWELEPHFTYYCTIEMFSLLRTFLEEKMSVEDVKSALYGKFVCEGKPIKKGFYSYMNLLTKALHNINKKILLDTTERRKKK